MLIGMLGELGGIGPIKLGGAGLAEGTFGSAVGEARGAAETVGLAGSLPLASIGVAPFFSASA